MEAKKLLEMVEALSSKYVDFWVDVCNLESPTADKQRVDACGKYFIDKAREKGWSVEINEQEKAGNRACQKDRLAAKDQHERGAKCKNAKRDGEQHGGFIGGGCLCSGAVYIKGHYGE